MRLHNALRHNRCCSHKPIRPRQGRIQDLPKKTPTFGPWGGGRPVRPYLDRRVVRHAGQRRRTNKLKQQRNRGTQALAQ